MAPKWNVKVFHIDFYRSTPSSINGSKVECKDKDGNKVYTTDVVLMAPKWNVKTQQLAVSSAMQNVLMAPKWNVKNDYLKSFVEVMDINGTKVECKVVLHPP